MKEFKVGDKVKATWGWLDYPTDLVVFKTANGLVYCSEGKTPDDEIFDFEQGTGIYYKPDPSSGRIDFVDKTIQELNDEYDELVAQLERVKLQIDEKKSTLYKHLEEGDIVTVVNGEKFEIISHENLHHRYKLGNMSSNGNIYGFRHRLESSCGAIWTSWNDAGRSSNDEYHIESVNYRKDRV